MLFNIVDKLKESSSKDYLAFNNPLRINLAGFFAVILLGGGYKLFTIDSISIFDKIIYLFILAFFLYYSYKLLTTIFGIICNLIFIRNRANDCYYEIKKIRDDLAKINSRLKD